MTRLVALVIALLFAGGVVGTPAAFAQTPKAAPPAKSDTAKPTAKEKKELLDINRASEDELKGLPGIGDAYAKKIVDGRPYKRKDELVQKKVLPKATYDKIKDHVVAKQN